MLISYHLLSSNFAISHVYFIFFFFFFNNTATTEIYTLSLHDALPILCLIFKLAPSVCRMTFPILASLLEKVMRQDRKSGSAGMPRPISYAVFCLKKKKNKNIIMPVPNKEIFHALRYSPLFCYSHRHLH